MDNIIDIVTALPYRDNLIDLVTSFTAVMMPRESNLKKPVNKPILRSFANLSSGKKPNPEAK